MRIGVPREVKTHEYRVGLVPGSVRELVHHGHEVLVETGAGAGIDIPDEAYGAAGAQVVSSAQDLFAGADLVVKVKEPQPNEIPLLRQGQVLFTYLHLAADKVQAEGLLRSGAVCIAYETVTDGRGGLPLLAPMSEVAGRMSVQVGAHYLEKEQGGRGVLLGGVPAAKVVVLGGGVAGTNAARMAMGVEAWVTVIDKSLSRLYELDLQFGSQLHTLFSTVDNIENEVLVVALKGADERLREKMFGCMSSRAADSIRDEMEERGPMRLAEVLDAQKEVLAAARRLADAGTIMLGGRGDDYV